MELIRLEHIQFSFGNNSKEQKKILADINLTITKGDFHLITGPSGSGKTTLLQILATLLFPTSGKYYYVNQEINRNSSIEELSSLRLKIGYLFQTPFLPNNLKVKDYIEIQAELSGMGIASAEKKSLSLLEDFGIVNLASLKPGTLSGGEKQRVALAGLFIKNSKLLLFDEPTGSLDYENKKIFWELLVQAKKQDTTVITVSHDESLSAFCDHCFNLDYGVLTPL